MEINNKMITHKANGKEWILVEVPKDAKNFTLINSHSYFNSPRVEHSVGGFDLKGKIEDYKILGLASNVIAEEIVESKPHRQSDYNLYLDYNKNGFTLGSAQSSLKSLCEANELNYSQTLIIEKL